MLFKLCFLNNHQKEKKCETIFKVRLVDQEEMRFKKPLELLMLFYSLLLLLLILHRANGRLCLLAPRIILRNHRVTYCFEVKNVNIGFEFHSEILI